MSPRAGMSPSATLSSRSASVRRRPRARRKRHARTAIRPRARLSRPPQLHVELGRVHAADHVGGRWIEDGVGEARPVLEVVGVRLQVAQVRQAAIVGSGARLPAGRHVDVLDRRRPRLVVGVVVLRPEWFEPELLRRGRAGRRSRTGQTAPPLPHLLDAAACVPEERGL